MRSERRRTLLRILREGHAATQQELVAALRDAGHDVTQATVSRDLHEIGAVKVRTGDEVAYRFPDDVARLRTPRRDPIAELLEFAIDVEDAGTLVVVKTLPGHASAVARALDLTGLPEVRGTIAGDDTVFVAAPDAGTAAALAASWFHTRSPSTGEVSHA
ncbi:MAG TPA: arginine repressor [Actinomycetota bacterium]|nr:arginine repressor [Actinomycetota bacterium]